MSPRINWMGGTRQPDIYVYISRNQARCIQCSREIKAGDRVACDQDNPSCLCCAGLDDLQFLPTGNVSVTGLAMGFTGRKIIVLRERRGLMKRLGILAPAEAIQKAREKSEAIAAEKAARRAQKWQRERNAANATAPNSARSTAQNGDEPAQTWAVLGHNGTSSEASP